MNVSVIIPVYNAAQFLRNAVGSALKLNEVKEILLIEDGSPDQSLSICKELIDEDNRIKLFQHPGGINKGAGASRNLGINKASGELIAFLDADDCFTDLRFERDLEIFASNPECDAVYGAMGTKYIDKKGKSEWEKRGFDENQITTIKGRINSNDLFDYLIGLKKIQNVTGYFSIVCLTLKKSSIEKYKLRFPSKLRLHQDTIFVWQCAYYLKLIDGECEKPIAVRSVHRGNRYIMNKNEGLTKYLMWREALKWSYNSKIGLNYLIFFQNRYFQSLSNLKMNQKPFKLAFTDLMHEKVYKVQSIKDIKHLIKLGIKSIIKN